MNGVFTISLDFELHWGGFEKWSLRVPKPQSTTTSYRSPENSHHRPLTFNEYFLNTRQIIPEILDLFKKHEVHATWAAVGMLLNKSKQQLLKNAPTLKPTYAARQLSSYTYIDEVGIGDDEASDPFHYAPSLVEEILITPGQELGTHTYSHFYCNERGQTSEQFREDLRAAKRVSLEYGTTLRSLVFPRNQFNDDYLKVCYEEGITSVRSNPMDWFWNIQSTQRESKWKRLNRGLSAYLPVGKKNTYKLKELQVRNNIPICLPASRLLRPYRPVELFLNKWKIERVKSEIEYAAKNAEVYHLWWHPHNFGWYPDQSLAALGKILNHFSYCRNRYRMGSLNMSETTDLIYQYNGKTQVA